ncbi:Mss4-like protein [Flammula alnicola]|nr:Mss4-like protein [Flammula alnicola]
MSLEPSTLTKVRTGSCLCKSVKYQVYGDPITFRICHCQNCRRASGSAFMSNVFFTGKQVRVVEGEDKLKVFPDPETASGAPLDRYFCSECGSNVFLRPTNKRALELDYKIISHGTLNEEVDWVPQVEVWPELRRPYVKGIEIKTPCHLA